MAIMNSEHRTSPRDRTYSAMVTWVHLCGLRLQEIAPLIDDEHALELASELRYAWPKLEPAEAAEAFFTPTPAMDQ